MELVSGRDNVEEEKRHSMLAFKKKTGTQKVKRDQYGCHNSQCFYFLAPSAGIKWERIKRLLLKPLLSEPSRNKRKKTRQKSSGEKHCRNENVTTSSQINVNFHSFLKKRSTATFKSPRQYVKSPSSSIEYFLQYFAKKLQWKTVETGPKY